MEMKSFPDLFLRETPDAWEESKFSAAADIASASVATGEEIPFVKQGDLASVLEQLSLWLGQTMPVEMLAYWNPRQRKSHLLCLAPAQDRQDLEGVVHGLVAGAVPRVRHWRQRQWFFHLWMGAPLDGWDRLLIVEKSGDLSSEECNLLIQEAANTFQHALRGAVDHP
ncbi:MAG: hypothetical protein HQL95_02415 [Magnetococcales bacterium]|nr:hypothetical protein [Magnetococcales bacterium]